VGDGGPHAPAPPVIDTLRARVQQFLDQHGAVLEEQNITLRLRDGAIHGTYRTNKTATATQIVTWLQGNTLRGLLWYVVRYHDCTHDEGGSCAAFVEVARYGPVPA
jgi:hypothetical protein